jgi:ribosome biogenesis GTPase A
MGDRKTILPSHMKKALDRLERLAGVVDLAIEVVDARFPRATRCDFIPRVLGGCDSVTVLTKTDIADPAATEKWLRHWSALGIRAVVFPSDFRADREKFIDHLLKARGAAPGPGGTRAVVAGLPNVGKSTLINFLIGRHTTRVGAAPGVTRGVQMANVRADFLIIDTPGIVSPRIARKEEGILLALAGCLQETFFESEETALHLLEIALPFYSKKFREYYDLSAIDRDPIKFCEEVARRRGFLRKGGFLDIERVYNLLIQDFSTGRISGITLESPD